MEADVFNVLALIAFGVGAALAAFQRSFALALVSAGLFLMMLPRVV